MSRYETIERPLDNRRNTAYDQAIKTLYKRGFTGYQIHQILKSEGAKVSYKTVYARIKEIKRV